MAVETATRDELDRLEQAADGMAAAIHEKERPIRKSDPGWAAFRSLGTQLWLMGADVDLLRPNMAAEFSHIRATTNDLVPVITSGLFDSDRKAYAAGLFDAAYQIDDHQRLMEVLMPEAAEMLRDSHAPLGHARLSQELQFIASCHVGLGLITELGGKVVLDLPADLSDDLDGMVRFGRRYYRVCPERFVTAAPFTPAGLLAARELSDAGVPVCVTGIYSCRQMELAACVARPRYLIAPMDGIGPLVSENGIGSCANVAEKTLQAMQFALWRVREYSGNDFPRLVAAGVSTAQQVVGLAGLDALALTPAAAVEASEQMKAKRVKLACCVQKRLDLSLSPGLTAASCGLSSLWEVPELFRKIVHRLSGGSAALSSPDALAAALNDVGGPGVFPHWTSEDLMRLREGGRTPRLGDWESRIKGGELGLDALLTASALEYQKAGQEGLSDYIGGVTQS